jgi:glycosyltransferase involved in cell wall biosynthesis
MKVLMLCPHDSVSGWVKVIFKIATGLIKHGLDVQVALKKQKDRGMAWYAYERIPFKIVDLSTLNDKAYNNFDCVVNYGDGPPLVHLKTKKVLFLQGFVQNKDVESTNLKNKYDKVITTSKWLYNIVTTIGHKNVEIIPPGIDEIFKPVEAKPKNRIPVIGTLFHPRPDKQFNLFVNTISKLFTNDKLVLNSLLLSAKPLKLVKAFEKLFLPYSLIVNPPQYILPHMYASCDIWFSTSTNEGFGLPPLEAMACGVPVVWYPNRGLDKYMNDQNCIIVRDVGQAMNAIRQLLGNKEKYEILVRNGKELAAKFTWENSIKQFARCLRSM